MMPVGEVLGIVDLVANMCKKTKHMSSSEIVVYNDNKFLLQGVNNESKKTVNAR